MYSQLLAGTFFETYGLLIILVVFLLLMFGWNFWRSKKYQKQEQQLQEDIKIGTKIKTYSGIYGTVVGFYDTTDGKVVKLSLDGKTVMEIDARAIYGVDNKSLIVAAPQHQEAPKVDKSTEKLVEKVNKEQAEAKVEAKKEEKPKQAEAKVEGPKAEEKQPKVEEKVAEKPAKKPAVKKTAKKESK